MTAPLGRQFGQRAVPDWRAPGWVDSYRPPVAPGSQRAFHQMTVQEFAEAKGTLFHGTVHPVVPYEHGQPMAVAHDLPQTSEKSAGIHIGTERSARERVDWLTTTTPYRTAAHTSGRIFPVRIREDIDPDMFTHPLAYKEDRGDDWRYGNYQPPDEDDPEREHMIEDYKNETEDPGSISWRVPRRKMLMTHGDYLRAAVKRGDWVNPIHARMAANPQDDSFFTVHETEPVSLGRRKQAA